MENADKINESLSQKFHPYSILTGLGKVEFLIYCVLNHSSYPKILGLQPRTRTIIFSQHLGQNNFRNKITFLDNKFSEFMGKTFQAAQLTHERFSTIDHSFKIPEVHGSSI